MTPAELQAYIGLGITATKLGIEAYNSLKAIWQAHGLTDEDINQIEQGIADEAARRESEREEMAKKGGDQ